MRLLKLIKDDTHFRFMWMRKYTFPAAIAIILLTVVLFFTVGLNFGIDF